MDRVMLAVKELNVSFSARRGGRRVHVQALEGVNLSLEDGEVLGIVGESGCGKTTLGRTIMRLTKADSGVVEFRGTNVLAATGTDLNEFRLSARMVFQDPYASLNPRRSIGDSIAEAGDINSAFRNRTERLSRIAESLVEVGLDPSFATRLPHELSGGQRQRVGIARAILPVPSLIIADEPVSALDVSVQAQVLNLLMDLRERFSLAMIFISHDIGVIGYVSNRIAVMYMGRVVETANTSTILTRPTHPYTQALMAAVPKPEPSSRITGTVETTEPPSQFSRPAGCCFAPRCPLATKVCRSELPTLRLVGDGQLVACHNV
jgi:oligopeptide/dipeptide ABC transporter ATP-binding protein